MTNEDVRRLILKAEARGRELNEYDAVVVLAAREMLQENPQNVHARTVCENFGVFMATGEWPRSFAEFLIPMNRLYTDEQRTGKELA